MFFYLFFIKNSGFAAPKISATAAKQLNEGG
jgi:hypothetical protein